MRQCKLVRCADDLSFFIIHKMHLDVVRNRRGTEGGREETQRREKEEGKKGRREGERKEERKDAEREKGERGVEGER
jgi:hypothetical protein